GCRPAGRLRLRGHAGPGHRDHRVHPVKQRDQIAMTAEEIAAFLASSSKLQLATINRDGTPHLVAMYYVLLGGRIAFWTYRAAQKARHRARDPRVACLGEPGAQHS